MNPNCFTVPHLPLSEASRAKTIKVPLTSSLFHYISDRVLSCRSATRYIKCRRAATASPSLRPLFLTLSITRRDMNVYKINYEVQSGVCISDLLLPALRPVCIMRVAVFDPLNNYGGFARLGRVMRLLRWSGGKCCGRGTRTQRAGTRSVNLRPAHGSQRNLNGRVFYVHRSWFVSYANGREIL